MQVEKQKGRWPVKLWTEGFCSLAALCAVLAGCSREATIKVRERQVCTGEHREEIAKWAQECISGANPHSDEEPEDWISECTDMAERIWCSYEPVVIWSECHSCNSHSVPCDQTIDERLVKACRAHGWKPSEERGDG